MDFSQYLGLRKTLLGHIFFGKSPFRSKQIENKIYAWLELA